MNKITHGIHHVGLTVSNLEASARFFTELLGWDEVRRKADYPAIFVSDGCNMITLWQTKVETPAVFDKNSNVGLHHIAFTVASETELQTIYDKLKDAVKIEFSPELLGEGPARHMMCYEPSGIRVEFIWLGK